MIDPIWVPAILVFLAAIFGTLALALVSEGLRNWHRRRQIAKRVKPVLRGTKRRNPGVHDLIRSGGKGGGPLGFLLSVTPGRPKLVSLLDQARVNWSPETFLILGLGMGFTFGATAFLLTDKLFWAAVAAAGGPFLLYVFVAHKRRRRFRQFEEEFPAAIDLLTRAIRAGHPLSSSLGMVADEGPPEVSTEFRQVFEEQRFGIPFDEALLGMVDRTDMVDVRIFAIAIMVQREVGGNLAETLENLAHTIRRRFYIRRQLQVYTAQGRLTGYALAALPPLLALGIYSMDPEYMSLLVTHLFGQFLLVTALVLQVIGALWIRKIIRIEI